MADPTEAELKEAARKALAAGDTAAAKRFVDAARKLSVGANGGGQNVPSAGSSPGGLPSVAGGNPDVNALVDRAMAAYKAGDDATGKALLTEANRAAQAAGALPEGFTANPYTGGLTDLRNDPTIPQGDTPDAAAYGMMQGIGFNFGDETIAAMDAATGGDYQYGLERARELERRSQNNPWAYYPGMVAGALLAPGAAGAVKMAAKPVTLGGKMLAGALSGGSFGGLSGFGDGEGVVDRLTSMGIGGITGAGIGGAMPLISTAAKAGWRGIADAYRNSQIGKQVGGALGISPQASRAVSNIVGSDDVSAMRASLNAAGPDAMLADASPALGQTLDGVIRSPVPGSRVAFDRIESRAGQSYDDLMGAVGKAAPVQETMEGIRTGSAPARKAAYDLAYSMPIDYSAPEGAKLLDEIIPRLPGKAISYANELMRLNGEKSGQIMASIADDGSVKFTRLPDVRQWDYIKQALDQLAESGDGAGALGGQTRMGAAYQGLAKGVRDAVADLVPEYRTALGVASDAITERNAVRFGSEMLSPKTTTYDALQAIKDATPAQIEAMKAGVRGQLDEAIGNVRMVPSDQNIDARQAIAAFKELTSPNAQKKLEALFGGDWPTIKAQLDRAGAALGLRARTASNAATAGRLMTDRAIEEVVTPGALRSGKPVAAVKDFIGGLTGASPAAVSRLRDEVKGEIADLLTRQGGAPQQALSSILAALSGNPINPNSGQTFYNIVSRGGMGLIPTVADAANRLLTR